MLGYRSDTDEERPLGRSSGERISGHVGGLSPRAT